MRAPHITVSQLKGVVCPSIFSTKGMAAECGQLKIYVYLLSTLSVQNIDFQE